MSEPQVPKNSTCLYCGEEVDSLHEECQVVTLSFDTAPLTRSMLQAVRNKLDSIDGHGLSLGRDEALFEYMVEFCFFISVDHSFLTNSHKSFQWIRFTIYKIPGAFIR